MMRDLSPLNTIWKRVRENPTAEKWRWIGSYPCQSSQKTINGCPFSIFEGSIKEDNTWLWICKEVVITQHTQDMLGISMGTLIMERVRHPFYAGSVSCNHLLFLALHWLTYQLTWMVQWMSHQVYLVQLKEVMNFFFHHTKQNQMNYKLLIKRQNLQEFLARCSLNETFINESMT